MIRIDECECSAVNQAQCSSHNYIIDIPLDTILQYVKQKGIYESNQKLFHMYHHIIKSTKVLCPLNGLNCNFSLTKRTLCLIAPIPQYLIFSYDRLTISNWLIVDILKSLIVIPKYYDFSQLFIINTGNSLNQRPIYELFGFIFMKMGKSYTCAFKCGNETDDKINWIYYDDDNVYTLCSLIDLISLCLKNCLFPVMFYYKPIAISKLSQLPYCSMDDCKILENYASTIDNLALSKAKFRLTEGLFNKDHELKRNSSHRKIHSHIIRNSSNPKNKMDDDGLTEYICSNCHTNNRIECILCPNCGESNEKTIEKTIKRRLKVMNMPLAKNCVVPNMSRRKEDDNDRYLMNNNNSYNNNITNHHLVKSYSNGIPDNYSNNNNKDNGQYENDKRQQPQQRETKSIFVTYNSLIDYDLPKQINPKTQEKLLTNANNIYHTTLNLQINPTETSDNDKNIIKSGNYMDKPKTKSQYYRINSTNTPTNLNRLVNISDTSSLVFEDRIKVYVEKKEKEGICPNYVSNNNSKEYSSSKPQPVQKSPNLPEMWICLNCEKVNKANEYKCSVCGLTDKKQRDVIEQNEKRINKSLDGNFTPTSREINSSSNQQLTAPSQAITLNNALKKVICPCYSNQRPNIIKNGSCTICRRVIDPSTTVKKATNIIDKEIVYKYSKDPGKDKLKDNSAEMIIKIQSTKKPITAQNRYEIDESNIYNSIIKNIKVSKDNMVSACNKRQKSEKGSKKIFQKKK